MSSALTTVFIEFVFAAALFVGGYATLLQPREKALSLPLAGRIRAAFGDDDTLRFVRFIGAFLMIVGVFFVIACLAALLNNIVTFAPYTPVS